MVQNNTKQMWKKGEPDSEGYFSLINSHSKKVLTAISDKQLELKDPLKLSKVQKNFFLGHGIKTNDPTEAAKIFLKRDHEKLLKLLLEYYHGKLGVYMVPPMFFGQVAEAINSSEKALSLAAADNVRGDIAERKAFYALKQYFTDTGDDVLIIHSHKFLQSGQNNEKDFIIINLSKGNTN
jgi:hypothetical protein